MAQSAKVWISQDKSYLRREKVGGGGLDSQLGVKSSQVGAKSGLES